MDTAFRETELKISHQLSTKELSSMIFLCGKNFKEIDKENITEGTALFSILEKRGLHSKEHLLFLKELLSRIGRNDILKGTLKTTKNEMEELKRSFQHISSYRSLLYDISENLLITETDHIMHLVEPEINNIRKINKEKCMMVVLSEMEKRGTLSEDDLKTLHAYLKAISRTDLCEKINKFENEQLHDVMTRWRSIRDQYRRERQQRERSGAGASSKKKKYIYFDRLTFLNPSMDLRPTQSNLTEREETGSDTEPLIDPVGDGEEVAGPSSSAPIAPGSQHLTQAASARSGPEEPAATASASAGAASLEEAAISSSPSVPLEPSPQPAGLSRRARRRREMMQSRRNVDAGVLNYLSRVTEDDCDSFLRSLAPYVRPIPHELTLRMRGCILILVGACNPPSDPTGLMEFIENWQRDQHHVRPQQTSEPVHGQQGSQAPPPRQPTPQPLPITNPQWQPHHPMGEFQQPPQYGHLSRPSAEGWSQPGFGRHGHIGGGYEGSGYYPQGEGYGHLHYGQYPSASQNVSQNVAQTYPPYSHGEEQRPQPLPPAQEPEQPPSPTYRNL